jgi:hypothetical protein
LVFDVDRALHLVDRTRQFAMLKAAHVAARMADSSYRPLIVFACGNERAAFDALVCRFAWFTLSAPDATDPNAEVRSLREVPKFTTSPLQWPETALSDALPQLIDQIAGYLSVEPGAAASRRIVETINRNQRPETFYAVLHDPKLAEQDEAALLEWVDKLARFSDHGLRCPLTVFLCAAFSRQRAWRGLFGRTRPEQGFHAAIAAVLQHAKQPPASLLLEALPAIRSDEIGAFLRQALSALGPEYAAKLPRVLRRAQKLYSNQRSWELEDVFDVFSSFLSDALLDRG